MVPTIIRRTEDRRHARQFLPHAVVAVQDLVLAERLERHDRVVEVLREARLMALVRPYHRHELVVPQEAVHRRLAKDH